MRISSGFFLPLPPALSDPFCLESERVTPGRVSARQIWPGHDQPSTSLLLVVMTVVNTLGENTRLGWLDT